MQQGKMFFFIGVIMALIQGGYARRIKPGHHIKAVGVVRKPDIYRIIKTASYSPLFISVSPSQAILMLIPAFILIGLSWNMLMLYAGLALYSFGEITSQTFLCFLD